jgi:streptogramin lyase
MRVTHDLLALFVAGTAVMLPAAGYAATVTGDVTIDTKPVRGALVTVFSGDKMVSETVFTDAAGHYRLDTQFTGSLSLRARAPLAADSVAKVEVPSPNSKLTQRFSLRRLTTPQEISDNLPASAHYARIKFPTTALAHQFQADCTPCHQIGNPMTRQKLGLEGWKSVMPSMLTYADYTKNVHLDDYAAALNSAFDGTPTAAHENTTVDEPVLSAKIIEWKLPESQFPHDSDVDPATGQFYTVDLFVDKLWITDPKTNQTRIVPIPDLGVPIGGSFAGDNGAPSWVPKIRHGNHSLRLSPFDGLFYFTGSVGGEIGTFDPVKQTYKVHKVGGNAAWPHTLVFDSKGIVWFTILVSNQIGRFDPKSGKSTLIELPSNSGETADDPADHRMPEPYGIDINPLDDSVWYTKIWSDKVGRVDPATLAVKEWTPPVKTPRRIAFDSAGNLWIPGMGDGNVAKLDTKTMKYEVQKIPTLAPDEVESPYFLGVNKRTQEVWISANQSDRMFRYVPKTNQWTAYPLPTRGMFQRDIFFTDAGWACAPSSPTPPEAGIDGSTDSLLCVQPEGNKSEMKVSAQNHSGR